MVALGVSLALMLGLGACGSDGGDDATVGEFGPTEEAAGGTSADGPEDLCALLEEPEVEEAFGGPVTESDPSAATCIWEVGDDPMADDSGSVYLNDVGNFGSGKEAFDGLEDTYQDGVTEIDGVGDEAFFAEDVLTFRSGEVTLYLQAVFMTARSVEDELTDLARLVLERL